MSSPNVGSGDNQLSAVTCVSANDCWAVGNYGVSSTLLTLVEQYNGSSWSVVPTPNAPPNSNYLFGVGCVTASDCWAVGYYNSSAGTDLTLIEQYNGSAWSIVSSPNPGIYNNILNGVSCTSASNCWAVGYYSSGDGTPALFEQYNGTTWSVVSYSNGDFNNDLTGIACVTASDCWAVGYDSVGDGTNITDMYQYDGSAWLTVRSPNVGVSQEDLLNGVSCVSVTSCWAVGYYENTNGNVAQTLIEHYDGSAWSVVSSPSPGGSQLASVSCSSATDCWTVGDSGSPAGGSQALFEHYNGHGWSVTMTQQPPVGGPVLAAELIGGSNCACANSNVGQSHSGDPVDTAYGGFSETSIDMAIPGRGLPLQFTRTYDSGAAATNGPLGYGWTSNVFTSLSQPGGQGLVTITQEGGAQIVFTQNGSTYAPAAPRDIATLVQNGDRTWTFVRKSQTTDTFSATGQLVSEKDLNGYTTNFAYNGSNQLTTITDPANRTLTIGWTGNNITTVTDPNVSPARILTYQYKDGNSNLTDVFDVNGGHAHFSYDAGHRLTNVYDANCYAAGANCDGGNGVLNGYDTQNRITSQKDQLGRSTTFAYAGDASSASGGTTTVTDPKSNVVLDTYQYGLLTAKTTGYGTPAAATWQYTYDPTTVALVSAIDPDGHMTSYGVDGNGNRLSTSAPLDRYSSVTYNSFNEPLTQTDSLNVSTTDTYDANGNMTSASRPLLGANGQVIATRTTTYNHTDSSHPGDVTSMVDPDNNTWNYGYDTYGDPASTTDPLGDISTATFNPDGWKLTSVSPRGNVSGCGCANQYTTTDGYIDSVTGKVNEFGDVTTVNAPLGHITNNHYDADRNLTSTNDPNGNATSYTFDLANEQTLTTRADHTTIQTDFNADGTVLDQKNGDGSPIQTYGYDSLARATTAKDALGNVTSYAYDNSGNRLTQQDPGGNCGALPATGCTATAYDDGNELVSITYSDGTTPNVSNVSYDGDGRRVSMTDGTGTSTWVWDSLQRITGFTDGHRDQVQYQYNLRGLVTQITYPGNLNVIRGYDNAGRWTSVKDWLNGTTTFGYDPDSNLTTKTLPTSTAVVDTSVVNAAEQLTSISDVRGGSTTLFSAAYGRDNNSQVATDSSLPPGVGSDRYTQLNQLCYAGSNNTASCVSPPTGSQAYSFDASDNLTSNRGTTQAFNAADELCWGVSGTSSNGCASPPSGATQYGYNTRGDRITVTPPAGSATTLGYDQSNRLTGWSQGTTAATYTYNGDGFRMSKTLSGVTTQFEWDISGQLPMLIKDGSSNYVYGPGGLPLEQITTRPAITRVGTATASGKSSSLVLTLPSGLQPNDQVFVASTQPSTTTVTPSSGYTTVTSVTSGGASPLARTVLFRHSVATGDTSVTLSYSTNTTAQSAVLVVYRGVDPGLPIEVSGTGSAAATTTVAAPSISPIYANDELLVVQGAVGTFSGSSWSAPSGTTERAQRNTTANVSTGMADQGLGSPGATGILTSTYGKTANLTTLVVAAPPAPTVLFYHADQLGSTRLLTDVVGAVRGTFTYDPYGNVTAFTGLYRTPLAFAAEYQDSESGLYYLRARYYDPTTVQFLTRDPMVATTMSPYAYVGGNPLNAVDPAGLKGSPGEQCTMLTGAARAACVKKTIKDLKAAGQGLDDFVNNNLFGFCIQGSLGFILGIAGSACVAFNAHSFGVTGTFGTGWEIPGGASLTAGPMFANGARNPEDLGNHFSYAGATAGQDFPVGGFEGASGYGTCGQPVHTYNPSVGIGLNLPWPFSIHEGDSNTWVWTP